MRLADQIRENVGIAIDTLRTSKLRSALTVLGVVIGISTVMAIATLINGVQQQIVTTIQTAGPTTFYVMKVYSETPLNPDNLPAWVRIRPDLHGDEAERFSQLPEIGYSSLWGIKVARVEYNGLRVQPNRIYGADSRFTEIIGGELASGRWFTRQEVAGGRNVCVLAESVVQTLFGRENPIGRTVQLGGRPATVIGVYAPLTNIFDPPGVETAAIVPFRWLDQRFDINRTQEQFIVIKPRAGVTVDAAQDAVRIALREMRGLRPSARDNFDFMTQGQILQVFNNLTGAFFLVMVALSSVGLLVGGIGVMAIMMVSVTSRTREIGVRKALGASRRDIMMQFLIEAATLTGIGGILGIITGLLIGKGISMAVSVSASTPLSYTVVAVLLSLGIGVTFGLVPARRAARMDPVEALRYE
ncbi:MAG: ABC transporter permease [Gemmatimonadaceae bacterium]|nr:ABC transporter permease [Gemmatimonadaceae bacterium]